MFYLHMLWYSDCFEYGCNAVERIPAVYQGLTVLHSQKEGSLPT